MSNNKKKCKVDQCEETIHSKGYCRHHYLQFYRNGRITSDRNNRESNEYIISGDITYILLYNCKGQVCAKAIIDTVDLELVSQFKWCTNSYGYCKTNIQGQTVYLHHLLLDMVDTDVFNVKYRATFINGNKLDCRRKNLLKIRINK